MGRRIFAFEWLIFIPAILLMCSGLVTLLSLSPEFFYQQLFYAAVSLVAFFLFIRIDFDLYHYVDRITYIVTILLLLLTFAGENVRGSVRWLIIGSLQIQPSEVVKPFFLVCLASLLVRFPPTRPKWILLHIGLLILPVLLIFKQPDLGNAIVYTAMWSSMIIVAGIPLLVILGGIILSLVILPLGYRLLHEYQKLRIMTFLNPLLDPQGAGYNAIQAMIAVGSGQLVGRGFGRGTQTLLKFLPEHHTDFIFATLVEESGFFGGMMLLSLFFVLLWNLLSLARRRVMQPMFFLYTVGFFTQILTHVIINIGIQPYFFIENFFR